MSKAARSNRSGPGSGAKRKLPEALSPRVHEMVDDLHAICDAVESGIPPERVARVRTFRVPDETPPPSPDEIRAIRDSLGLSRAGLAEFLGTAWPPCVPGSSRSGSLRLWPGGSSVRSTTIRRTVAEARRARAHRGPRQPVSTGPPPGSAGPGVHGRQGERRTRLGDSDPEICRAADEAINAILKPDPRSGPPIPGRTSQGHDSPSFFASALIFPLDDRPPAGRI